MIGKTISHYQILEKLGEDGMRVVYKVDEMTTKAAAHYLSHSLLSQESGTISAPQKVIVCNDM